MYVYLFSKKNSSSILFVKLAQLRIKMSCLSSSPHVGFWKHYASTYLVVCSIALYIYWFPTVFGQIHWEQFINQSAPIPPLLSCLCFLIFLGVAGLKKNGLSSQRCSIKLDPSLFTIYWLATNCSDCQLVVVSKKPKSQSEIDLMDAHFSKW